MKKLSMFDTTFVVFVIVNVLAAVTLHVAGIDRHNPSMTNTVKMFVASLFASFTLFAVIAKLTGRKPFWQR